MSNFAIVSDNCFGTLVYNIHFNLQYTSPFVNMFIHTPHYIRLLENFFDYMKEDLKFIKFEESEYANDPLKVYIVGKLKDVEICFPHPHIYANEEDVYNSWNRRKERLPLDEKQILFKLGSIYTYNYVNYDNFEDLLKRFYNLNFTNKISFTRKKYDYINNYEILPEHFCRCDLKGKEYYKYFNLNQLMGYEIL